MNKYLISVETFFGGTVTFTVSAVSKPEAVKKAKIYVQEEKEKPGYNKFNEARPATIKCLKKIQARDD